MKRSCGVWFWVLGVFFSGCAVGPNYRPPRTATPGNWSDAQVVGTTNTAVQVVQWWKTFNDPELDSLVERAVQANYDLRIAEGRLREARALRSGAIWDFGPTINASGGYTKQRRAENAQTFPAPVRTDLYDAHFDATWEIDVFGGKRRALESATAQFAAIAEDRRDILVSVLAEVARNYVEVRGFQQRLAITRKNIRAQSEAVDIT